ncbi:uncharacterized protein At4g15545-like isoform X2 [Andrographis paniculata]|uniref:uncharacterized protein At4g15545-like isoform X2 n=1 Tax=Andrographis paniculata TaxID=175694 RepID=UPI0021E8C4DD|nr:uncharacterized protein At4g15545-like isoform X2 [Andrographis paniculata]
MLAKEAASFGLSDELLEVLPADPFAQLDVARKITSIALSTRVDALESELSLFHDQLADRDHIISGLESQLESLDVSLNEASDRLAIEEQEKENLVRENSQLKNTVEKLNRDVAKVLNLQLEAFRKTLMRSLEDDEDSVAKANANSPYKAAAQHLQNDDVAISTNLNPSMQNHVSDAGEAPREARPPQVSHGLLMAYQTLTPQASPPRTPSSLSTSVSPSMTPRPLSPRRHSISISAARSFPDNKSSLYSSMPSMAGSESGLQPGKTRVDGKEFFRQVRTRLSYEQFGAFLANVKELNSLKQTKEETLRKADDIFGTENRDLYAIFEGLILRNVQ